MTPKRKPLAALTTTPQDTGDLLAATGLTQHQLVKTSGELETAGLICAPHGPHKHLTPRRHDEVNS